MIQVCRKVGIKWIVKFSGVKVNLKLRIVTDGDKGKTKQAEAHRTGE